MKNLFALFIIVFAIASCSQKQGGGEINYIEPDVLAGIIEDVVVPEELPPYPNLAALSIWSATQLNI